MDIIQSALSGNTSGPSLCVDTGSEVSDSVSSIVTAGRASESFSEAPEPWNYLRMDTAFTNENWRLC